MSFCEYCDQEFEGGEDVIMVIEGVWGISEMSGRAILVETPRPAPKYWHPVCYVTGQLQEPECESILEDLHESIIEEMMTGE